MKKFNKKVFGIIGLTAKYSNWNADFNGYPKTDKDGKMFASDKALKFAIRRYIENEVENSRVFYKKTFKSENQKDNKKEAETTTLKVMNFPQRFQSLFGLDDKEINKTVIPLYALLQCDDVRLFGTAAPFDKNAFSVRGVVQINHGENLNDYTGVIEESILSPFSGASEKESNAKDDKKDSNTTIGKAVIIDRADYFYNFAVIPNSWSDANEVLGEDKFKKIIEDALKNVEKRYEKLDEEEKKQKLQAIKNLREILLNGKPYHFTEDDYLEFKEAALKGVTAYNSAAKVGCENSFAVFLELKEESHFYPGNLVEFIEFDIDDTEEKGVLSVKENFFDLIKEKKEDIDAIEIYYNPNKISIDEKTLDALKETGASIKKI